MSTFYTLFPDPSKAKLAVMRLIEQGVPTDDISLVFREESGAAHAAVSMKGRLADATSYVGRDDDPLREDLLGHLEPERPYYAEESAIGGGISTSQFNDSAPTIDETDDPQSVAEDAFDPTGGVTQGDREVHDLDLAVETGFPTTTAQIDDFEIGSVPPFDDIERSLETVSVPTFGSVIGGGPLATAALDFGDGDPTDDETVMRRHFGEEGVPDLMATTYLDSLRTGKALLAVGLVPGEVESPLVEAVAQQFGGENYGTFDSPRY